MKRLIVKAKYGQDFTHNKLPKLFLKLLSAELSNPINITMLTYIRDNYNINTFQLILLLQNNLRISGYVDNVIIDFNTVKIAEQINEDGILIPVYLETLIHLIDYGNLEVKGTNIISNIINYLQSHIDSLYKLSRVRGGSAIWA